MRTVVPGLLTGLSLIVAIGAQNAFVLRQGLRRDRVGAVVLVCALSDLVLIAAGVAGIGAVVDRAGWVIDVVRWLGVAFLIWYGVGSLRRASHPGVLAAEGSDSARVVTTAVLLTWLNPHVYLDTVLLLGSIANTHGVGGRWWFALGAGTASVLWFSGLGYGARLAAPVLARPTAWRVLDVLIGLTMLVIAARLAMG
ncbi:LysE/ArgO family amino acid transporter [Nocardioides sp. AN3]